MAREVLRRPAFSPVEGEDAGEIDRHIEVQAAKQTDQAGKATHRQVDENLGPRSAVRQQEFV